MNGRRLRPSWFKAQVKWINIFCNYSPEDVGAAFLAALDYCGTGKRPTNLSGGAEVLFAVMAIEVMDACERYEGQLQRAKRAAEARQQRD